MSTPYPPQPRRLMRDPSHKLVGGVCSGLAKYLNMDVNLVRILTVVISLFTGIPIVLYIIALFVLPEERPEQQPPYVHGPQPSAYGSGFTTQGHNGGYQQPTYGQPTPPADDVWGSAGAPWEQPQTAAPASAPAGSATSASATSPSAPAPETRQQPVTEPTLYDTAPTEPETDHAAAGSPAAADAAEPVDASGPAEAAGPPDAAEPKRDS